eukprot:472150-Pleurochrysis_carterae.AAC.3
MYLRTSAQAHARDATVDAAAAAAQGRGARHGRAYDLPRVAAARGGRVSGPNQLEARELHGGAAPIGRAHVYTLMQGRRALEFFAS